MTHAEEDVDMAAVAGDPGALNMGAFILRRAVALLEDGDDDAVASLARGMRMMGDGQAAIGRAIGSERLIEAGSGFSAMAKVVDDRDLPKMRHAVAIVDGLLARIRKEALG